MLVPRDHIRPSSPTNHVPHKSRPPQIMTSMLPHDDHKAIFFHRWFLLHGAFWFASLSLLLLIGHAVWTLLGQQHDTSGPSNGLESALYAVFFDLTHTLNLLSFLLAVAILSFLGARLHSLSALQFACVGSCCGFFWAFMSEICFMYRVGTRNSWSPSVICGGGGGSPVNSSCWGGIRVGGRTATSSVPLKNLPDVALYSPRSVAAGAVLFMYYRVCVRGVDPHESLSGAVPSGHALLSHNKGGKHLR